MKLKKISIFSQIFVTYKIDKNTKNSENLKKIRVFFRALIIKSRALADIYKQNFQKRLSASMILSRYENMKNDQFSNSTNQKGTHRKHKDNNFLEKILFE